MNSWAQTIIVCVIVAVIIEMILPNSNNKKYVKIILGIYILLSIVYPIVNSVSNGNISLNSIITSANKEMDKYNMNTIDIETNKYIETTYKKKLREDIIKEINEKGYRVLEFNLYIEMENEERYAQINSIVMNIEKINEEQKETTNIYNKIKEVKIDISNNKTEIKKEEIPEDEINSLKEYLENSYSIEKERIHINE